MMQHSIRIVSVFAIIALLSACASAPKVNADYDTAFTFTSFNSYQWAPSSGGDDKFQTIYGKRVEQAIERNLNNKGQTKAGTPAQADFLVHYHVSIETKIDIDTYYDDWGYRGYWGPYYGRGGYPGTSRSTSRVREYKEGTLVIDIIDRQSKTVVWRGSAEDTLKKNMSPQERDARINDVVNAILAKFPPVNQS